MKKKVLILVDWYTPGFRAGGPIRSCANLVEFLKDEIEFSVITTDRDLGAQTPYENIPPDQWIHSGNGSKVFYASPAWLNYSNLQQLIQNANPDYILLNSMYSKPFTLWPLKMFANKKNSFKILLAPRGMLRPGALAIKPLKKKIFLIYFKLLGWNKKIQFVSTGNHETEDIQHIFGEETRVKMAPNLPSLDLKSLGTKEKKEGEAEFIYIGRISKVKNTIFAIQILNELKGNAHLRIFGPEGDIEYAAACKAEVKNFPSNVRISFEGELENADVPMQLAKSHFFLMPSLSENFGHAIFEALSHGMPVIIGDQTPWRGLENLKAGWDISLEDKNSFFKAVQQAVSMNGSEYAQWSSAAWKFANEFATNHDLLEANRQLFQD